MNKPRIRIADHAKLRYLERVMGIDVAGVTAALERKVQQAHDLGASGLLVDGVEFVMSRDTLVTIKPRKQRPPRRAAQRAHFDDWGLE